MLPFNITLYIALGAGVICGLFGFEVRNWEAKAQQAALERALYAQRDAIQKQLNDKSAQFEALRVQSEKDHEQDKVALSTAFKSFKADPVCAPPPAVRSVLLSAIQRASAATTQPSK